MSAPESKAPGYMAQLLEELGWNQGTRIPLANPDNQNLETILIDRQKEIQQLKETLILQKQKHQDLYKYKEHVHTEYQENTRLLFAHKQQLEQEVKLRQLSCSEADILDRDISDCNKQTNAISSRIEKFQSSIARLLKKADTLKGEVCGERGAIQEWRAALERSAGDITAIEQFTKQDISKAKALEVKRLKLKVEHDHTQERLHQLVSNLSAEERACERISVQVIESMEQRKQMMTMWTNAIENLRQRDTDIRHIREDYAVLDTEANNIAEQCREQQGFCDQQRGNNNEAEREIMGLMQRLSGIRNAHQETQNQNLALESETQGMQRELSNMRAVIEKLNMENRQIMEAQHRKDVALKAIANKISELKSKLVDSTDKTTSSEKRAKELEELLNEEEHYASQMTVNQQRAMHCSFNEQQKLIALKNDEKLFHMQIKASKGSMSKLDAKQRSIESSLQNQKETLYGICYQVETVGAQVLHMEGQKAERDSSAELLEREIRLKQVRERHAARVTLLERHSAKLHEDMRKLARELESKGNKLTNLQSHLKSTMLEMEGGEKEARDLREEWRRARVDEALLRLRSEHATRALDGLGGAALSLDTQRLHLDAAMKERLIEISARRDMFNLQKRTLFEECGKLRCDIREREQRIEQLIKRYDIFIASLGKDESGQTLSVTFFKIKFAAERADLRARGAALDADVTRLERDVRALEDTLRLVHAAHTHFVRRVAPLQRDTPEIQELNALTQQYYDKRDDLKELIAKKTALEEKVNDLNAQLTLISDQYKQLTNREMECESQLENSKERLDRQETRLQNAQEVVKHNAKRAKKLVNNIDQWRIFQLAIWLRDYLEASQNALRAIADLGVEHPGAIARIGAALAAVPPPRDSRLLTLHRKIIKEGTLASVRESSTGLDGGESVFSSSVSSSRSGVSVASGFTKRLTEFRRSLAPKVQELALVDDIREQARRSSISLRVVTLGLEDYSSAPNVSTTAGLKSRKSFR